jgi:hypothetical protein
VGVLLILLLGSLAPSTARAECGDYVAYGALSHSYRALSHPVPGSAHTIPLNPPAHDHVPRRCSGPMCSRAPLAPPDPASEVQVRDGWGLPTSLCLPPYQEPDFLPLAHGSRRPVHRPSPPYHPPRTSIPPLVA